MALMAPAAYAQQSGKPAMPPAATAAHSDAQYLVFFDWNKAILTAEARQIVAKAAAEFKQTGAARLVATGYTDLSGTPQYNYKLSVQRAESVKAELVRLGVPASAISTVGRGEEDPLVPTKDGVREPQNRRVSIVFPLPPKPVAQVAPPAPVVAAAPPPPPPPPAPKWSASLGPWYGYNIREKDPGNPLKSSNLVGPEVRVDYAITPNWLVGVDGAAFNTVGTSSDDGWGGRGLVALTHQWNLGDWHPFIGPHAGYIFGKGVEDGAVIGPELGVNFDVSKNLYLYARAAYDHDFRNEWTQGIPNGGLGAGYRF
ncbi:MAG: OmpA family protein [Rhodospirillales bacterium]|nr:OmpA family protein [Rhodospirillales bacterium]